MIKPTAPLIQPLFTQSFNALSSLASRSEEKPADSGVPLAITLDFFSVGVLHELFGLFLGGGVGERPRVSRASSSDFVVFRLALKCVIPTCRGCVNSSG